MEYAFTVLIFVVPPSDKRRGDYGDTRPSGKVRMKTGDAGHGIAMVQESDHVQECAKASAGVIGDAHFALIQTRNVTSVFRCNEVSANLTHQAENNQSFTKRDAQYLRFVFDNDF